MKRIYIMIFAVAALLAHAAPNDALVFKNTTKYVDMNGNSLFYYNTSELQKLFNTLPDVVARIAAWGKCTPEDVQLFKDSSKVLLKYLNFAALQAVAVSTKEQPGNMFITKDVAYLGKNAALPGLFNISKFRNDLRVSSELEVLPADLLIAMKFKINIDLAALEKEVNASGNEQLKMNYSMIKTLAGQFGVDLNRISDSVSGNVSLIIAGNSDETLRMILVLPDNNGALGTVLKRFLAPDPQNKGFLVFPQCDMPHILAPRALCQDKKVVLMSNVARCTKKYPPFKVQNKFKRHLPVNAAAYTIVNITDAHAAGFRKYLHKIPAAAMLVENAGPICTIGVSIIERDALRTLWISDFSIATLGYKCNDILYQLK